MLAILNTPLSCGTEPRSAPIWQTITGPLPRFPNPKEEFGTPTSVAIRVAIHTRIYTDWSLLGTVLEIRPNRTFSVQTDRTYPQWEVLKTGKLTMYFFLCVFLKWKEGDVPPDLLLWRGEGHVVLCYLLGDWGDPKMNLVSSIACLSVNLLKVVFVVSIDDWLIGSRSFSKAIFVSVLIKFSHCSNITSSYSWFRNQTNLQ